MTNGRAATTIVPYLTVCPNGFSDSGEKGEEEEREGKLLTESRRVVRGGRRELLTGLGASFAKADASSEGRLPRYRRMSARKMQRMAQRFREMEWYRGGFGPFVSIFREEGPFFIRQEFIPLNEKDADVSGKRRSAQ